MSRLEATTVHGGALTTLVSQSRVSVARVVAAVARAAVPMAIDGPEGQRIASTARLAPPGDGTVVRHYDAEAKVPAGAVLLDPGTDTDTDAVSPEAAPAVSHVLGRAPAAVAATEVSAGLGPLDEAVYNPQGFPRTPSGEPIDLDPGATLTRALVLRLREAPFVRVTWPTPERLVAGLAMAGTVLVSGPVPQGSRARLGGDLCAAIEAVPPRSGDPDHDLRREEHSVRVRRAALVGCSIAGWRGSLAARGGERAAAYPSLSVLLATRRPEQLAFALAQVARQRHVLPGAEVELVLATHGFAPDPGEVAEALGGRTGGVPHQIVPVPAEAVLGEVLRAASDVASGDVVMKMDDDDWYAPDVVTDLLLARRHSGADLVGMPAELVRLEGSDVTVRRRGPSENHGAFVAGGTLCLDRVLLRELGGFRPLRQHEDARLLHDVRRAGGSTYRSHGLGYVLRRRASGHTWDPGDDYFLRASTLTAQWPGLRPSALMELDQ